METSKSPAPSNQTASYALFAAIAGAPLPFGSVYPASIALWCVVLGVGALFASPRGLRKAHVALLAGMAATVLLYALVLHEQLSQTPWFAAPNPIWSEAAQTLGAPLKPSVSITRNEPFYALGAPLAGMLALACGLVVGMDRARARQVLQVTAWSGAAYAAYGILALLFEPGTILWREKTAYVSVLTATFVNRNTAAAYFGACAVVWLLLLCENVRRRLPSGPIVWTAIPRRLFPETPRRLLVAFCMLFLCLAAMFMTGSRGGVVLSLLALVVAFALFFRHDLPGRSGLLMALAGAAAVALVLLQIMGAGVSSRFDVQGLADEGRIATWRATVRMIAEHPWFGTGLGTFEWTYPAYRSGDVSMWGVWDRAHSTPLELAAEAGLPLAAAVAVGWLVILGVLLRGAIVRRRDVAIPLAALAVALLALGHSAIDFPLQIPGFSIVVLALIGAGLAQSFAMPDIATRPERRGIEASARPCPGG
jgi:O-antigen ligase